MIKNKAVRMVKIEDITMHDQAINNINENCRRERQADNNFSAQREARRLTMRQFESKRKEFASKMEKQLKTRR